ncbi:uncharacterized protein [Macrobrachium rosenbergii]|uniref:uncharacterized protein isoform X2 n=1 Tax=Macrobrachium rosenbergii TaxID=79674 RepID=UPI0034D44F04
MLKVVMRANLCKLHLRGKLLMDVTRLTLMELLPQGHKEGGFMMMYRSQFATRPKETRGRKTKLAEKKGYSRANAAATLASRTQEGCPRIERGCPAYQE